MDDKEVTIYDIAKQLNIAPSTVSRGLNGHFTVSLKTQKKIAAVAESMGYRSNKFAANLRMQRTNTIGVIVPKLSSYFVASVLAGIEKATNAAGYNLIISQSMEDINKEIWNVKTMFANRVDGLLVSLSEKTQSVDHFNVFFDKSIPVLFFDRVPENKDVPSVVIDNVKAGYQITKHLLDQGAKRIMHVTGNLSSMVYKDRLEGYCVALREAGVGYQPELLIVCDLSEEAGTQSAKTVVALQGDAAFVTNDTCAASCLNELKRLGKQIPDDILMAGFNNDMISRNVTPPLTTINYPGFHMGELAAKNLIDHLEGRSNLTWAIKSTLKSELLVRESSSRKRGIHSLN